MINNMVMTSNYLLIGLSLFAISCKSSNDSQKRRKTPPDTTKPNVLFICIDDLRPDLGCYGNEIVKSPNLDKLAKNGIVFTNQFVQVPTCGASRACLLTGMLPHSREHLSNAAIHNFISGKPESKRPETFIHHLRKNGYYTAGIGKISHYPDGLLYGQNDSVGTLRELPQSWDELLFDPGKWGTGWNAFFGYADGTNRQGMNSQVKPYEKGNVGDNGYPDGLIANLALEKLQDLSETGKPFFLGVGFFKPHLPFTAPAKYWDLYNEIDIPVSPNPFIPENVNKESLHGSNELNRYLLTDENASLDGPVSDDYARKLIHAYYACISYIDAQVGRILKELDRLGMKENTIIVIWGDHGWHLGDHLVWGKHTIFERALKSAFIISSPETSLTGKIDKVVSSIDIYPTIVELCGLKMPHETDGKSLVPLLNNPDNSDWKNGSYGYFRNGISLRTDKYRLTKYFRELEPLIELYDHEKDPNETKNIASKQPEVIEALMPLWEKGNTGLY